VAGDWFGIRLAISGTTAVVSDDPGNLQLGQEPLEHVYVFTKARAGWKQIAELKHPLGGLGSVAISGTTVLVVSGDNAGHEGSNGGRVLLFTKTPTGWEQTAEFNRAGPVAISGTTAVVGSQGIGCWVGAAYVFAKTVAGWRQVAKINGPRSPCSFFASSVAISGGTVLVGGDIGRGHSDGRAHVYVEATGWKQAEVLKGSTSGFGWSVAISGTTAIVGCLGGSGPAYLFHV